MQNPTEIKESQQQREKQEELLVSKESRNEKEDSKSQRMVRVNEIAIILFFSALSAIGGTFLILFSLGIISISSQNFLEGIFGRVGLLILFVATGTFLVTSPFFLNRIAFDAIRYERNLRMKAQKHAREAELLQDILTHDIRNYNQVSRLSAELIQEQLKDKGVDRLVNSLLDSIDGSTLLVERAKMLSKVIGDSYAELHPTGLVESIRRSFSLVTSSHPEKQVTAVLNLKGSSPIPLSAVDQNRTNVKVFADNLIDEIFSNIISNSVKYTDGREVFISIEIAEEYVRDLKAHTWRTTIADLGKGIPEEQKPHLFSRYLTGAKGSGLGLSIAQELAVERYGGKIRVGNRTSDQNTKGTLVEIWLRKA